VRQHLQMAKGKHSPIRGSTTNPIPWARILSTKNIAIVVFGMVAFAALWRYNRGDIPKIMEIIFSRSEYCVLGWVIAIVVLASAIATIAVLMRTHRDEISRLAKERDDAQRRITQDHDDD